MSIEKTPFRSYTPDDERDPNIWKDKVLAIRFNQKEWEKLQRVKKLLQQPKDATALKQCFDIGYIDIHGDSEASKFRYFSDNVRKNARLGIVDVDEK